MKYNIKREIANDQDNYRYFAEDENGRYIDSTVHICPINAPQENQDFAVDVVIHKLKQKLNPAETIKTIEL